MRDRREAVDDAGAEHHGQRVQRAVGQRHAAQRLQHHDAGDGADREPDAHLPQELPGDVGDARPTGARRSSIIPIISAIPTGSLNPDSPSRIVPERPSTSLPASTENVTAGSVGASAAPIRSETVQSNPSR